LAAPVDRGSLEFFRILFGGVLFCETVRYLSNGWVDTYNEQVQHLHFPGFEWVAPLPHELLVLFFLGMGVLSLMICFGFLTRFATISFFLGFVYWFTLEATDYLNHLYLVGLLSFLLAVLPVGRRYALDALIFQKDQPLAPRWTLEILRWQVGLVYLFGGLAKLNPDWLAAQPLQMWLEDYGERGPIGALIATPEAAWVLSYSGLVLDLVALPMLLWRRTRVWVMVPLLGFHMTNAWLFQIGIFPWLMSGALLLYLDPDWLSRLLHRIRPQLGMAPSPPPTPPSHRGPFTGPGAAFFGLWLAVQVLVPLRHLVYPGNPSWTEEGHWFSWHMKLRSKRACAVFEIEDLDTGDRWKADLEPLFDRRQRRKLAGHPEWIRQTAGHLSRRAAENGHPNNRVRVDAWTSLNGRAYQRLVDPDIDLAAVPFEWSPAQWIMAQDPSLKLNPEATPRAPCR
jgi:hypothetical protein